MFRKSLLKNDFIAKAVNLVMLNHRGHQEFTKVHQDIYYDGNKKLERNVICTSRKVE